MTANSILDALVAVNIAGGLAILAVLVVRGPIRRLAGARFAYLSWLVVPCVVAATFLPARTVSVQFSPAPPAGEPAFMDMPALPAMADFTPAMMASPGIDWPLLLVLLWIAGALVAIAWLAVRQAVAIRSLGALTPLSPTTSRATRSAIGPAVVGVLAPRIVLPADFEQSFDDTERRVVLAHEETHLHGRHTAVKLLVELAVCLSWFNPLAHIAARAIAMDQELTCDEAVAARFPADRKAYAGALLKTQAGPRLPLGCYWPSSSARSLKTRIRRLGSAAPGRMRKAAGAALIVAAVSGAGIAAWAVPDPAPQAPPAAAADRPTGEEVYLRGKVERIDFSDRTYDVYVRGISLSPAQFVPVEESPGTLVDPRPGDPNHQLWRLSPTAYWGDRDAVLKDLADKYVEVRGVRGTGPCAPICQMQAASINVPAATQVAPVPAKASLVAEFARAYDSNRPAYIWGAVESLDFSDRTFDAWVRVPGQIGLPDVRYQVRSEYRHPRAAIEKALAGQSVYVSGWRARGGAEGGCAPVCGLYAVGFRVGDTIVSPAAETLLGAPDKEPTTSGLGVPLRLGVFNAVADPGAPMTIFGTVLRIEGDPQGEDAALMVEIYGAEPVDTPGGRAGTEWRVVGMPFAIDQTWASGTVIVRGFNARDKSCRPTCTIAGATANLRN